MWCCHRDVLATPVQEAAGYAMAMKLPPCGGVTIFFRFSPKVPKVKFVPGRKRCGADLRCPGLLATSGDAMCGRQAWCANQPSWWGVWGIWRLRPRTFNARGKEPRVLALTMARRRNTERKHTKIPWSDKVEIQHKPQNVRTWVSRWAFWTPGRVPLLKAEMKHGFFRVDWTNGMERWFKV